MGNLLPCGLLTRSDLSSQAELPLLVTGAWSQLIKNHHFNPQSEGATVCWNRMLISSFILIYKLGHGESIMRHFNIQEKGNPVLFFSYTLSPGSTRIFLVTLPCPSRSAQLSPAASGWSWPCSEAVEWNEHWTLSQWIGFQFQLWHESCLYVLLIFPSTCVHSHLLSHVVH